MMNPEDLENVVNDHHGEIAELLSANKTLIEMVANLNQDSNDQNIVINKQNQVVNSLVFKIDRLEKLVASVAIVEGELRPHNSDIELEKQYGLTLAIVDEQTQQAKQIKKGGHNGS